MVSLSVFSLNRLRLMRALGLALVVFALGGVGVASWAQTSAVKRGEPLALNFVNADIEAVARTMAVLTGRNVVVDPRVKGQITLTTDNPVSSTEAYNLFLGQLRMLGYAMVQAEGVDKVVPEADGKLLGSNVAGAMQDQVTGAAGNQLVTQIFKLQYENANNVLPVLRPLINPNNPINVNPANNSLVITDYADNLRRLARIVAVLDTPNATDVEIIPVKYAPVSDLAPLVLRLLEGAGSSGGGQSDASFKTAVVPETRTNSLIVRAANPARLAQVKSLIAKLDQPSASGNGEAGNIYVVRLKNANAVQLAPTLRAALGSGSGSGVQSSSVGLSSSTSSSTSPTPATPGSNVSGVGSLGASSSTSSASFTGGQIQADATTNSLIITASEPQYRQLRAVIEKLDTRRAQVFVESLIVEVSEDKAAEFSMQLQTPIGSIGDSVVAGVGTNFGSGGSNIATLTSQISSGNISLSKGMNLVLAQNVGGNYVLGFLGRFMQENGIGNVLSTPNLLTLDNEEAKIVIGQNVPFVTGQYTSSGTTTSTVNPFQTIERKDVGLTLKVKPQISENGSVKLAIYQEVSSVQASTANATNGPTTNKRTIESNVLVQDGAVVVLGGLLQDEYAGTEEKVPGLADIPILGALFRSETRSRKKTNLMVFLRPVVVRDVADSDRLAKERYGQIRDSQLGVQPASSSVLQINTVPVLPTRDESITTPGAVATPPPVAPVSIAP